MRERAVHLVFDQTTEHNSQWACIEAMAPKIECTRQTLRTRIKQAEIDQGRVDGVTTSDRDRLNPLERENRELKQANEIFGKASAYFVQAELDRRWKP